MGKPAKKRSYWEAKKRRAGELQAEREDRRKALQSVDELPRFIIDKLQKAADRIDPMEAIATIGLTPVVHSIIIDPASGILNFWKERGDAWNYHLSSIQAFFDITESGNKKEKTIEETALGGLLPGELVHWLLAFAVAYIIIRHGGQLLGLLGDTIGGLFKIVPMLLGVTTVA